MAEYIEREALLKEVDDLKKSPWYNDDYGFGTRQARHEGVDCVVDLCIKQAPTADVVEVVRCKDCKHGRTCADNDEEIMCVLDCEYDKDTGVDYGFTFRHSKTHFCSYGERLEADGDKNG